MKKAALLLLPAVCLCALLAWELSGPDSGEDIVPARIDGARDGGSPGASSSGASASGVTAQGANGRSGGVGAGSPSPSAPDAAVLNEIAAIAAARPLFSQNRRPPDRPDAAPQVRSDDKQAPRLAGVIVGPAGALAIFTGTDGKSRTAGRGDKIGVYTIREISPGRVVVTSADGERVLEPNYLQPTGGKNSSRAAAGAR